MRSSSFALLLALLSVGACTSGTTPAPPRPNVLLVSIDSLRADHVHAYGYERPTSPTIDSIAADGVLFEQAISPSSWTLPTHVTLLTALPPELHRVENHRLRLSERGVTLAEMLREAGYETAAVVGGPLLRSFYGHDQGFDLYDDSTAAERSDAHRGITSPKLVDRAMAWVRGWHERGGDAPFFLFLHLWDVHYDYAPPAPYDTMFDPDYTGDLDATDFERHPDIRADMPKRDLEHLRALYDGEIRFTDEQLGRLIEVLRSYGALDDTIVVVTADHGDEFFEHGRKGHRKTLFEEIVRIPFVLRYPRRVPSGQVVERQVRLMDVAPTVLSLAGVANRDRFGVTTGPSWGRALDLSPWIDGRSDPADFPTLLAFGRSTGFGPSQHALRTEGWKVVRENGGAKSEFRHYDLERDPAETRGMRSSRPREDRLQSMLEEYERSWTSRPADLAEPLQADREHESRLRALGYIE